MTVLVRGEGKRRSREVATILAGRWHVNAIEDSRYRWVYEVAGAKVSQVSDLLYKQAPTVDCIISENVVVVTHDDNRRRMNGDALD